MDAGHWPREQDLTGSWHWTSIFDALWAARSQEQPLMSKSGTHSEVVLALAEEFVARYRNGERPSLREYTDRHPELAAEIREVFPVVALMENIALVDEREGGAPAPAAPETVPLQQLGDYRLIRTIGHGGMGIVYEAEQVSLGRHVALKVLPRPALLERHHLRRFQREAKAAARLHHTNIVPVYGVGEENGLHYYVMQFIQGLALDKVLAELRQLRQPKQPAPAKLEATRDVPCATGRSGFRSDGRAVAAVRTV